MRRLLFVIAIACFAINKPLIAQTPPTPNSKITLKQVEQQLKEEQEQEKSLKNKIHSLETELGNIKKQTIKIAKTIKTNEGELSKLETHIQSLQNEKNKIADKLNLDKSSLSRMVIALHRLERLPPEAIIAKPDEPLKTAQSAMLLEGILPVIHDRTKSLQNDLQKLEDILLDLKTSRETKIKTTLVLSEKQKEIALLLKKRQKIFTQTQKNHEEKLSEVANIVKQAATIKDLVEKIDKNEASKKTSKGIKNAVLNTVGKFRGKGKAQLPVSGILVTSYGQKNNIGAISEGIEIQARTGALVVSPLSGIVRYTGTFKNYGNITIIEHAHKYHSLVAGLDRIDTVVGQTVDAGEPIGILGTSSGGSKPFLYYELRYKGQAINPARKFADLKS